MPRANKQSTLARQWELMKKLPQRRPGLTAGELKEKLAAAGHAVTKRTVERDLVELADVFPLLCNEASRPYGWYWEEGAHLKIPGMELTEAISLGLLEDVLRQLIPSSFFSALEGRFEEAQSKLAGLPDNPHAKWTDLVCYTPPGFPFLPPEVLPGVISEVQQALLHRHQITVEYAGAGDDKVKELLLHPLALIQQGVRPYLLATTFDYEKPVYYALHRMQSAVSTGEPAKQVEGFDLERFIHRGGGQFGEGKVITLKAQVTEGLAALLRETPLSEEQSIIRRGGKVYLTASVFDSWQLRFWILSQSASILVQQPRSLKNFLVSKFQESLDAYANNQLSE